MKKKRRLRKSIKRFLIFNGVFILLAGLALILYLFVFNNIEFIGIKSVNADAKTYKTKSCLAFYPDSKEGKKYVEDLCNNAQEEIAMYDYALIPYGDYYLVEYGGGNHYYIDHNNNLLVIDSINSEGKKILSEYLKYDMKKAEIDKAYTLDFIEETKNIDFDNCEYQVEGENLNVYYPQYDFTSRVPLKYIQKAAGINLGFVNELYKKPKYISPHRKIVAFTFDDGPYVKVSSRIIDTFYKYDGVATYFVAGYQLIPSTVDLIRDSIEKGNEYGSHTQSHANLQKLSKEEEYKEIMQPVIDIRDGYHSNNEFAFDGLGYEMKIYRAPYGSHKSSEETAAPFISIEWDCDSNDWKYRDKDKIIEGIYSFEEKNFDGLDGCIVLFHDLYEETADAIEVLVPELIKKGYQFVSVSELLDMLGIDKSRAYYPW